MEIIVSDLTYVRVGRNYHYICILLDLFNREIRGYACGRHKNAKLVQQVFSKIKGDLRNTCVFHSERGSEFDNLIIDEGFDTFDIKRSLSKKGCLYDNAAAEATFKTIKKEFVRSRVFATLEQLENEFEAFSKWFNNERLHSSLGYIPPIEYRESVYQKVV